MTRRGVLGNSRAARISNVVLRQRARARDTLSSAADKGGSVNFSRARSFSFPIRSPFTGYSLAAGEESNKWHGTRHPNSGEVGSGFLRCAQDDTKKRAAAGVILERSLRSEESRIRGPSAAQTPVGMTQKKRARAFVMHSQNPHLPAASPVKITGEVISP